jgi:pyruvate/2-oxoglutarate dehydrogenase complex dihydrolipoamide acyltransferase (E2) component
LIHLGWSIQAPPKRDDEGVEVTELFEVKIPHSGSVENVEISEWLVKAGQVVSEGEVLAEVSTDKVDTELEAPQAGRVVKLLVDDGTEVPVGTVVALLIDAAADEDAEQAALAAHPSSQA